MKILHYAASMTRSAGGLFNSVSGLARAQTEAGADVAVLGGTDQYFSEDRAHWHGIDIYPVRTTNSYGLNFATFRRIRALAPNILHVHGIWNAATMYGLYGHLFSRSAVVVSPRGMLDPWILGRRPALKTFHGSFLERPLLKNAFVHALNESERESIVRYLPSTAPRTFVVPNGISELNYTPEVGAKHGVLYLGRLHEKKQVVELIRSWPRNIQGALPLTIAGWGTPAYEQQVHEAASAVENVRFVGQAYGQTKIELLSRARFLILPSLSEGLPMTVLEGLTYGCIPLITEACNLPQLLSDNVALRLEPDLSNLQSLLKKLLSTSPAELDQRSRASLSAAARFSWHRIAKQMVKKYEEILF